MYYSPPSVPTTLFLASGVGIVAAGLAALIPPGRYQIIATGVIAIAAFTVFAVLFVPVLIGPPI